MADHASLCYARLATRTASCSASASCISFTAYQLFGLEEVVVLEKRNKPPRRAPATPHTTALHAHDFSVMTRAYKPTPAAYDITVVNRPARRDGDVRFMNRRFYPSWLSALVLRRAPRTRCKQPTRAITLSPFNTCSTYLHSTFSPLFHTVVGRAAPWLSSFIDSL